MENWTEIKTAYLLGRLGTVSATAEVLGVHRATILRRVESLEEQLGGKLFQRHAKGYTPTEFGAQLVRVAGQSDDAFKTLIMKARTHDSEFEGEFVITCPEVLDHYVFPAIKEFKDLHHDVAIHFRPSNEVLKLEYGDADVAITFGDPPQHPDYVVRPLTQMQIGLYCSIFGNAEQLHGLDGVDEPCACRFVVPEENIFGESVAGWIQSNVSSKQIVMTCSTIRGAQDAILSGLGAGFLPTAVGNRSAQISQIIPPLPEWNVPLWIVTHVDLHRSAKVQSFLTILKAARDGFSTEPEDRERFERERAACYEGCQFCYRYAGHDPA